MTWEAKCAMCKTALAYPDNPQVDVRMGRKLFVSVPCPKCPATHDVTADSGFVICFVPNQPLRVKVAR